MKDPYGVVLIIGPFNGPLLLLLRPAIATLAGDRTIATGSLYTGLVGDLMNRGVQIELCGATAKAHKWGNGDLLPGVKINTDAMARTTELVQQGFIKMTE